MWPRCSCRREYGACQRPSLGVGRPAAGCTRSRAGKKGGATCNALPRTIHLPPVRGSSRSDRCSRCSDSCSLPIARPEERRAPPRPAGAGTPGSPERDCTAPLAAQGRLVGDPHGRPCGVRTRLRPSRFHLTRARRWRSDLAGRLPAFRGRMRPILRSGPGRSVLNGRCLGLHRFGRFEHRLLAPLSYCYEGRCGRLPPASARRPRSGSPRWQHRVPRRRRGPRRSGGVRLPYAGSRD